MTDQKEDSQDLNQKMNVEGKNIQPPFLPNSRDPKLLAELLDKIVNDKQFCDELAEKEHEYIKKISEPTKVVQEWEKIFNKFINKTGGINRKTNQTKLKIEKIFAEILEKVFYKRKMRKKNIKSWGKIEYERLMK